MSTKRIIYKTKIEKIIDHTPSVRELVLKFTEPKEFIFRTGQFAMLHVPQPNGAKPALRAYSIASDDRLKNEMRLIFKFVPNGVASTFVWSLHQNQELDFTGPFGRVFFQEPPSDQIIFISTGTGLAPHLSYLDSKAHLYPNVKFRMLFGVGTEKDLFCLADLDRIKKNVKDFQYHIVLSRPSDSWKGFKGYVQNFLPTFDYKSIPTSFYICGNGKMINQTKEILIQGDGIDATKIHSEAFD